MFNTEGARQAPSRANECAAQAKRALGSPMHPPVYPTSTPAYPAIGQTPPYPGVYAVPNGSAYAGAVPGYAFVPAGAYAPQWGPPAMPPAMPRAPAPAQAQSQAQLQAQAQSQSQEQSQSQVQGQPQLFAAAPQQAAVREPYAIAPSQYMATPLLSPVPSITSPPSLSPGIVSPPPQDDAEALTPVTPTVVKPGPQPAPAAPAAPATFTFKVRPYNELSPGNGVKHFAQLVVDIFSTRPDEMAFPLVDAMVTREFNTQRRRHEEDMEVSELEKKDENGYYVCRLCGPDPPRYLHLKSLVRHTSTHFIMKPFSCLFCEDRFTRTDVARKHLVSCRVLRACLLRFGPERAVYIQRVMASAQRCMPGMPAKERHELSMKQQ